MQDYPGAPGTARQGRTGTSVPTDSGGVATQPRAPSHERPLAAQRAAGHGWLSAALEAPGADVPLTTTARAPGHNCLSAVPRTPGHGRPLAAQRAAGRDRLRVAFGAPGADVPLATTAGAPGHHRLSAAPIATAPLPAGVRRLRQGVLPRVPANPRTLIYLAIPPTQPSFPLPPSSFPPSQSSFPRKRESTSPRCYGGTTGGLRTGHLRCVLPNPHLPTIPPHHPSSASCRPSTAPPAVLLHRVYGLLATAPIARPPHSVTGRGHIPSPAACSGGGLGRGLPTAPLSPRARAGVRAALPTALTPLPSQGRGRGLGSPYPPSPHGGEGARG